MTLIEYLMEAYSGITYQGFKLYEERELEEDNVKIWHTVYSPEGKSLDTLDHSPYEWIDEGTFAKYVDFYKKHGRFPTRTDIRPRGPLHNADLEDLIWDWKSYSL